MFIFCLAYSNCYSQKKESKKNIDSTTYYTKTSKTAIRERSLFPEKSYDRLTKCYSYFSKKKDLDKTLLCLVNLSDIQKELGKLSLSFEHLWQAQYLVKETDNYSYKAIINRKLSYLYDNFNKDKESLFHLQQALNYSKKITSKNNQDSHQLNANYLNLAARERQSGNYDEALKYIDSCIFTDKMIKNTSYSLLAAQVERGFLLMKLEKTTEAAQLLNQVKKKSLENNSKFKTRIYYSLGELKTNTKEYDSAIYYFENSLKNIKTSNANKSMSPYILNKLSNLYYLKNKPKKAYKLIIAENRIKDSLSEIKNRVYNELFEIKNTYLESIRKKDSLLEQKNNIIEKNEQTQFWLKIIIFLVILLAVGMILMSRMRLKLKKTLLDKTETELQSKIQKERSKAKIELKSKELTAYALQLIDKDSAIDELLKVLKEKSPSSYKSLNNKYKKGAEDLWDEFNLRFTEVNSDFYNRLKEKHPNCTPTEQKHLALIKLKFSTKEMARILNIEPHSVHISRSRIRKKIGLERADSLEDYVANL
ncbi:hypothetical protein GCM10022291_26620 [Postechiella marina]|uniref:HTH luxR-type domain-containing protein n=1 Tax=Postechiella marina TaxID=943941 RepID=A0ABP8CDI9_9FLAO